MKAEAQVSTTVAVKVVRVTRRTVVLRLENGEQSPPLREGDTYKVTGHASLHLEQS